MTRILRAPGKTMWIGEYVVLDGAPAVVAAVDRHATCTITPHSDPDDPRLVVSTSLSPQTWRLRGREGAIYAPKDPVFRLIDTVRKCLKSHGIALPKDGAQLHFDSAALSDEAKLGLGSSAAIAALSAVALSAQDHWLPQDGAKLHALTHRAHQAFQGGVGSGSDVAAACMGGVLRMQKGQPPTPIESADVYPVILFTGQSANTADFVRSVQAKKEIPRVKQSLADMEQATLRGISALESARTDAFLDAVRHFHRAEVQLTEASNVPIVTDEIATIVEYMETCGGAAKASGAGGGDIVIAFFADRARQEQAAHKARNQGLRVVPLAVESRGVLVS